MSFENKNVPASLLPAADIPADLEDERWRVVVRDGAGLAEYNTFSFVGSKSTAQVREWAARKFSGKQIVAVFPRDFETRNWAVLHAYREGLPAQCDLITPNFSMTFDLAICEARRQFREDNSFTCYPTPATP